MKKSGYYSSGEFARMAHVTLRTIRYYDKQNILKPSYVTDAGARFYTDEDFARLQQILLLKYLGFSLDDIRGDDDCGFRLSFYAEFLEYPVETGSGPDRADAVWWRRLFRIPQMRSRQNIRLTGVRC